jgi:hypothetical protein
MRFNEEQLRELDGFQSWNEGKAGAGRLSLFDYVTFEATPDLLLGFAALFFCELTEVDGHYFIAGKFDAAVYEDWKRRKPDAREIQRAMNNLHMSALLQNAEATDSQARVCAQVIAAAWNEVHGPRHVVAEVHGTTLEDLAVTLVNAHE